MGGGWWAETAGPLQFRDSSVFSFCFFFILISIDCENFDSPANLQSDDDDDDDDDIQPSNRHSTFDGLDWISITDR